MVYGRAWIEDGLRAGWKPVLSARKLSSGRRIKRGQNKDRLEVELSNGKKRIFSNLADKYEVVLPLGVVAVVSSNKIARFPKQESRGA